MMLVLHNLLLSWSRLYDLWIVQQYLQRLSPTVPSWATFSVKEGESNEKLM